MLVLFKWLKLFFDISIVMPWLNYPGGGRGEFPDNESGWRKHPALSHDVDLPGIDLNTWNDTRCWTWRHMCSTPRRKKQEDSEFKDCLAFRASSSQFVELCKIPSQRKEHWVRWLQDGQSHWVVPAVERNDWKPALGKLLRDSETLMIYLLGEVLGRGWRGFVCVK